MADDLQFEALLQMHRDTHELVQGVKDDVAEVSRKLDNHVADDTAVHDVVKRHTTYWKGVSSAITAALAYFGLVK